MVACVGLGVCGGVPLGEEANLLLWEGRRLYIAGVAAIAALVVGVLSAGARGRWMGKVCCGGEKDEMLEGI